MILAHAWKSPTTGFNFLNLQDDEEAEKLKEQRLQLYAAKKANSK